MSPSKVAQKQKDEKARARRAEREAKRAARRTGGARRALGDRAIRPRILIVCEGARTEPGYFQQFRVPKAVCQIHGIGENTLDVVNRAIELRTAAEGDDPFSEAWAVFDRDSFPAERFNAALHTAAANDVHVAYSNEAFELWYLCHWEYCDAALDRTTYSGRIARYLGRRYQKNDPNVFYAIREKVHAAIRHAEKLRAHHGALSAERANPSTTVDRLVARLIELESD